MVRDSLLSTSGIGGDDLAHMLDAARESAAEFRDLCAQPVTKSSKHPSGAADDPRLTVPLACGGALPPPQTPAHDPVAAVLDDPSFRLSVQDFAARYVEQHVARGLLRRLSALAQNVGSLSRASDSHESGITIIQRQLDAQEKQLSAYEGKLALQQKQLAAQEKRITAQEKRITASKRGSDTQAHNQRLTQVEESLARLSAATEDIIAQQQQAASSFSSHGPNWNSLSVTVPPAAVPKARYQTPTTHPNASPRQPSPGPASPGGPLPCHRTDTMDSSPLPSQRRGSGERHTLPRQPRRTSSTFGMPGQVRLKDVRALGAILTAAELRLQQRYFESLLRWHRQRKDTPKAVLLRGEDRASEGGEENAVFTSFGSEGGDPEPSDTEEEVKVQMIPAFSRPSARELGEDRAQTGQTGQTGLTGVDQQAFEVVGKGDSAPGPRSASIMVTPQAVGLPSSFLGAGTIMTSVDARTLADDSGVRLGFRSAGSGRRRADSIAGTNATYGRMVGDTFRRRTSMVSVTGRGSFDAGSLASPHTSSPRGPFASSDFILERSQMERSQMERSTRCRVNRSASLVCTDRVPDGQWSMPLGRAGQLLSDSMEEDDARSTPPRFDDTTAV
eukprot:Hpha_TRINITY_DN1890_c0_g1::TRINITY_DN1890_c0_g1_i1::g.170435::m.170435